MSAQLNEYNEKRDFEKTLEPEGRIEDSDESLKFVVQHHMARREHYDLRLEWNGVLLSWAVPKGPSCDTHDKRLAVQVENHPLDYRNFEGTIPRGEYGGGVVMIWDEGWWEPCGNVEDGLATGSLKFMLHGRRLKGKWALVKLKKEASKDKDNWLLLKEKDEYAKSDRLSQFKTSIRTGRTMEEISEDQEVKMSKNPFNMADVQLAKLEKDVPTGEEWLYELKYDGYRIMAFVEDNNVRLMSRNNNDYSRQFSSVASALNDWADGRAMVLDGEAVVTDAAGKTDFQAIQSFLSNKARNLTYIVFDILALDGEDLRGYPLVERKKILESIMKNAPKSLFFSGYVKGNGKESLAAACEAEMEGIVGKKAYSIYSGTRNGDWIKIKCSKRQEFLIGGYTLTDKKAWGISSLLLGVYEGDEFVYVGRAGTGISEGDMRMLLNKFENLKRGASPYTHVIKIKANEKITWLEPEVVAEIKFAEWTKENLLRQASFKGVRTDKDPKDVKREGVNISISQDSNIMVEGIKITSPDKVLFDDPQITKLDVVTYYSKVAGRMLPYVKNRILSVVRCPKGVSQACFFKKHPGAGNNKIMTMNVSMSGRTEEYFYIENSVGLISETQMGTLEFHTWGSRVENIEKPDMMVFDLDPDEDMELDRIRKGVEDIKSILDELSLKSYLKTSGGKGYHVVVPLNASVSWDVFHDFARKVAEVMEKKWPERYTSNVRKNMRTNKIFIDWIRNARGSTSVAAYSLRAKKGAKVSMPIAWEELYEVAPDGIGMVDVLTRIEEEDPWKDFFQNNQMLK